MIGDGMGPNQVEAARWEKAGHNPVTYRSTSLAMDRLAYRGTVSTASANSAVTDSAAAVTALMTGTKTDNGVIGLDPAGRRLTTVAEMADAGGRVDGRGLDQRITHATPAGVYAHVSTRDNELLIARQFIDSDLDVALGGGYRYFISTATTDPWGAKGYRTDGRNLVSEAKAQGYTVATTASALSAVPATAGTKVLGLFASSAMAYESERAGTQQPSLTAMTSKALSVLSTDPDGFFLMVEGAHIDTAAHANDYADMTGETLAFDSAVQTALTFASQHPDTLLIVTADHETGGLTMRTNADGTLSFRFTTTGHTATNVPIRASGPGAERFSATTVPNTQVFAVMRDAMNPGPAVTPTPAVPGAYKPLAIPGTIQAEDYNLGGEGVAFHDTTAGNDGGVYRNDGVDIESGNGITDVGWIRNGEVPDLHRDRRPGRDIHHDGQHGQPEQRENSCPHRRRHADSDDHGPEYRVVRGVPDGLQSRHPACRYAHPEADLPGRWPEPRLDRVLIELGGHDADDAYDAGAVRRGLLHGRAPDGPVRQRGEVHPHPGGREEHQFGMVVVRRDGPPEYMELADGQPDVLLPGRRHLHPARGDLLHGRHDRDRPEGQLHPGYMSPILPTFHASRVRTRTPWLIGPIVKAIGEIPAENAKARELTVRKLAGRIPDRLGRRRLALHPHLTDNRGDRRHDPIAKEAEWSSGRTSDPGVRRLKPLSAVRSRRDRLELVRTDQIQY